MKTLMATAAIASLVATSASAQIMTQSTRFAAPGESENKKTDASPSGVNLLPQATVSAGSTAAEVGLQVGDLYLNSQWRLYIRTNLPLKTDTTTTNSTPATQATGGAAVSAGAVTKPSDHVVAALLDEYGGLLNSTVGTYRCLLKWASDTGNCSDLQMPDHGLFFDGRLGMKFIDLPAAANVTAPTIAGVSVTPFYTGVLTLRLIAPLFDDTATTHLVGGLTLNASYVVSRVADSTLSDLFKSPGVNQQAPMDLTNQSIGLSVGINLGGVTYLSMSGTPWASDGRLGKRFVVALNIARPTKDAKPAASGTKAPSML